MRTEAGRATVVRVRTNAKVNLFLRVLGRRPDGYHELESIFHAISLGDDLEVRPAPPGDFDVRMRMDDGLKGEIPALDENLVTIAARRLAERGATDGGITVDVVKRIPIGAGLGGGSGNAAGILVALNELWGMELSTDDLHGIAGGIGSDVPFCLGGGTALATARGEHLTALPSPRSMCFVLGISHEPLATRDVYAAWDELGSAEEVGSAAITFALGADDPAEVASLLHNDLEPAAFELRPGLLAKKEAMLEAGALGAAMSGSGPTIYGIARDPEHARAVARGVSATFDRVCVAGSSSRCVERLD